MLAPLTKKRMFVIDDDNLLILPNIIGHRLHVWPEGSDVGVPEDGVSVPVHGHQPGVAAMIRL